MGHVLNYKPDGEVAKEFMKDDHFVRGIRGPVGSGKSVCCCVEIMRRALQQKADEAGKRRSRWAVIRNTFPELKNTTVKTWLDWFPENVFGKFNFTPPYVHKVCFGDVELEVLFLALDQEADVKKLLSLELTGVWINEAREINKIIVDACTSRVGRFPGLKDGGPSWYGVIMDTNSMPEDHWWPIMSGESPPPDYMTEDDLLTLQKPKNWTFFTQPPGMLDIFDERGQLTGYELNPKRENGKFIVDGYYDNMIQGKDRSFIKVYVQNKIGTVQDGKVVYPEFSEDTHVAKEDLQFVEGNDVYIGIDFGLTPAAIFGQKLHGRWLIQREICARDMGAKRLAATIKHIAQMYFPGARFRVYGDPAGDQRAQTDETTPFQILRAEGINAIPAPGNNDIILRTEAVRNSLNSMVDGKPSFLLSPACVILRAGFLRGYHYRKIKVSGGARFADSPDKNKFSHPHDALQYLLLGGGDGRSLVTMMDAAKPTVARQKTSVMQRNGSIVSRRKIRRIGSR